MGAEYYVPLGTLMPYSAQHPVPDGWAVADGHRVYKRDNAGLYEFLRVNGFRHRWLRWRVFLPDHTLRVPPAPRWQQIGGDPDSVSRPGPIPSITYIIKTDNS